MKSHTSIVVVALALFACDKPNGGSSAAGSASTTAAITSVPTAAATNATATTVDPAVATATGVAGGFEPTKDEWFGLQQKMMGSYEHFDTCAKLAANLNKWNAENKEYMTKFRAWAKTDPDRAKTFKQGALDAHKADMVSWPAKISPAQKCQTDAKVGAALKAINEE